MIVVDDPGTWSAVYPPLLHAEWNGWTYTDTIFPFFLFLAGVSLVLSFSRRAAEGRSRGALLRRLAGRAAALLALGLALNLASYLALGLDRFRIPGVLQRIGVCVFAAGAVWLLGGARASGAAAAAAAVCLVGYGALLQGGLDPSDNLAARVDRAVFGAHTWKPGFDPEGILSTIPAIATTLLGTLAGARLRSTGSGLRGREIRDLAAGGALAAAAGLLWGRILPINKNLWTSPYALLTAGLAALALAACMTLEPWSLWRRATAPLQWLGRNAIAAFTLSTLGAIGLLAVKVEGRSLWRTIHVAVFDRFADPRLGSLLFALAYLAVWIAVCGVLYRKRIFLRVLRAPQGFAPIWTLSEPVPSTVVRTPQRDPVPESRVTRTCPSSRSVTPSLEATSTIVVAWDVDSPATANVRLPRLCPLESKISTMTWLPRKFPPICSRMRLLYTPGCRVAPGKTRTDVSSTASVDSRTTGNSANCAAEKALTDRAWTTGGATPAAVSRRIICGPV